MATTHGGDDILPAPVLQDTSGRTSNRQRSNTLASYWANLTNYIGSAASPTDSSVNTSLEHHPLEKPPASFGGDDTEEVDEIVVDRSWSDDWRNSDSESDHDASSPGKSGPSNLDSNLPLDPYSPAPGSTGFWVSCKLCILVRWRIWPAILGFFSSRFLDDVSEQKYKRENWSTAKVRGFVLDARKAHALYQVSGYMGIIVSRPHVALGCHICSTAFQSFRQVILLRGTHKICPPRYTSHWQHQVSPLVTLPLFFFVLFDFPRDRPIIYQLWLCSATYSWSVICPS
jgi:osomolarity two-component system, sensor histidine kinase SLN1